MKMSNGDILGLCAQLSFWLLCLPIVCALRHLEGAHHLSLAERGALSSSGEKENTMWLLFLCCLFLLTLITPFWLLCCHIARMLRHWEGILAVATRTPSSFLGWEKGTLSSGGKENTIWLLFLCCLSLAARALRRYKSAGAFAAPQRAASTASWHRWLLISDACFLVIARPHWKKKEGSRWGCCHQLACMSEFARRRVRALATEPAEAFVSCRVFFLGGVL